MMKKKSLLIIILMTIIIPIFILWNSTENIELVSGRNDITNIRINGKNYEEPEEVEKIIGLLDKYDTQRTKISFPIDMNNNIYEIDYIDNNKPRHIMLGNINIIYESADQKIYEIISGDELIAEIEILIGEVSSLKQELMKVDLQDHWNELWNDLIEEDKIFSLSPDQIARVNEMFVPAFTDTNGNLTVNPISCFFTSYYNGPEDIDFDNFLRYFPYYDDINDVEELNSLKKQENWPFGEDIESISVPIHKYLAEEVEQFLWEFAGIKLENMNGVEFHEVLYLEEYDSYYNYTSDFGPASFECDSGEVSNGNIRLYDQYGAGKCVELTLEKQNGRYVIVSHQEADDKSSKEMDCNVIEFDYTDTFLGGKESFPTYGNLVKTFGEPTEVRNVIDEDEIPIYGYFSALVYDDIEFVFPCSGNENDKFFIKDNDRVCRVDITGDKYSLDGPFFGGMGIGSSADEIVEFLDKEIREINYSDPYSTCLEIVVIRFRNDVDKYDYERGIYFSGEMDTGLALGVVYLIDDNDEVVRIVMGWPTAG
jgi:hypothetical protein